MASYTLIFLFLLRYLVSAQSIDPCRALSEAYQSRINNNETNSFRPSEVLACLRTVPVNETLAVDLIEWYQNFIQFQSTLAYLRDPPPGYQLPAVDILGGLRAIQSRTESGKYNSTFYLESDLNNLVLAAYDGHFGIATQLSASNFPGYRNVQLASFSKNGTDLPKVYFAHELTEANASDLVSIDGIEVSQAIESSAFSYQNLDALYNSMFYSRPASFIGSQGFNTSATFLQNDNITYEFRNGTIKVVQNSMVVGLRLHNITSGQDLYDQFLLQPTSKDNSSGSSASQTTAAVSSTTASSVSSASPTNSLEAASIAFPRLGYPIPLYVNSDFILAGFFLPNSTDTCVLSSTAFEDPFNPALDATKGANATAYALSFQETARNFLAACTKDGRSKLLIDIRSNIGGNLFFAYDLFGQLFPSRVPYTGTRFRAHPAADIMGQVISTLSLPSVGEDGELAAAAATDFDYKASLSSPSEAPFSSWKDLYGPVTVHNDTFTNLLSWDLSNVAIDLGRSGLVPAGSANNTQLAPQPFDDENIILITDAQCSSTCATFANLLLAQTNISTIAFGGRPSRESMAVIGGVEGSERDSFRTYQALSEFVTDLLTNSSTSVSASQYLNTTKEKALEILRPLTMNSPLRTADIAAQTVNFLDSIPKDDPTMTPWQFLPPTLADCRAFYLAGDILNVTYTWERVAKGDFVCVDGGSLGRKRNGTSTPVQPYMSAAATVQFDASFVMLVSLLMGLFVLMG